MRQCRVCGVDLASGVNWGCKICVARYYKNYRSKPENKKREKELKDRPENKKWRKEYDKKRRKNWKDDGICIGCGKKPAKKDYTRCQICLDNERQREKNNPERSGLWARNNPERDMELKKRWLKNNPEKVKAMRRKSKAKRRGFGDYEPEQNIIINEKTEGHHYNNFIVFHIPKDLHTLYNGGPKVEKHRFMCNEIVKQVYQNW